MAFLGMVALVVGAGCAFWVIVPRTKGSRRGLIFWEAIAEYDTGDSYGEELLKFSMERLFLATVSHCVDLAKICRGKYKVLRCSLLCGVFRLGRFSCCGTVRLVGQRMVGRPGPGSFTVVASTAEPGTRPRGRPPSPAPRTDGHTAFSTATSDGSGRCACRARARTTVFRNECLQPRCRRRVPQQVVDRLVGYGGPGSGSFRSQVIASANGTTGRGIGPHPLVTGPRMETRWRLTSVLEVEQDRRAVGRAASAVR